MWDEGVIYVAGHPLLNRRCTRLPGVSGFEMTYIVSGVALNCTHSLTHYRLSPLHFHPNYHEVQHYKCRPPLILATSHIPTPATKCISCHTPEFKASTQNVTIPSPRTLPSAIQAWYFGPPSVTISHTSTGARINTVSGLRFGFGLGFCQHSHAYLMYVPQIRSPHFTHGQ